MWAAAGVAFYGTTEALQTALADLGQSGVVYDISFGLMGKIGGILAVVGVVICPISSGDTAFRGARIVLSECFHIPQKKLKSRLLVTLPLLVIGAVLTQIDFDVLWRYFSWSNQTLAMIALWVSTSYLIRHGKNRFGSLLTAILAYFMSAVSMTYILMAPEGFRLSSEIAYPVGMLLAATLLAAYLVCLVRKRGSGQTPEII